MQNGVLGLQRCAVFGELRWWPRWQLLWAGVGWVWVSEVGPQQTDRV